MVAALILFLIIIIFLAFFVGKNLLNVCTIWFFKSYVDINVAMLVFIAFGAGIVFSLLMLFASKIKKALTQEDDEETADDKKSQKKQKAEAKAKIAREKKLAKISNKGKKRSTNKEDAIVEEIQTENPTETN